MTVHVIGNCTVDVIFDVPRFPRPGETLIALSRRVELGGKGVNQAVVASRFGVPVRLTTPLGQDAEGAFAERVLAAEGFGGAGILRLTAPTDQSIINVAPGGENTIVSSAVCADGVTPGAAVAALSGAKPGDWLVMQGNLGRATTEAAFAEARRRGLRTFLNPAPVRWPADALWPLCDVAVLNRVEAAELLGADDPKLALERLVGRGVGVGVVTLGGEGALWAEARRAGHAPAPLVTAIDTAGAGDAFCGGVVCALALGLGLSAALAIGSGAAGLAVSRHGTHGSFPSKAEAAEILARRGER